MQNEFFQDIKTLENILYYNIWKVWLEWGGMLYVPGVDAA